MDAPVYVINRTVDTARLARFMASAADHGLSPERIPALDGHDPLAPLFLYRRHLRASFWGEVTIKPGAFACYLGHAAAWARLVASGADLALICEDDATFLRPPGDLVAATRAQGGDLVFANARLAKWRAAVSDGNDNEITTAEAVLSRMAARGLQPGKGDLAKAPGADAYLLSRAGAEALLAGLEQDGVTAGVDWTMLWRGRRAAAAPDWPEAQFLATAITDPPLDVRIAAAPICAASGAPSVLRHGARTPIADLRNAAEAQPLSGPDPALTRLPDGDARDPVFADFAADRFHEKPALEMMRRWMPEGGLFVDIGAHAGGHTLFMLRHGGAGRAIPLEFNPRLAEALRAAVSANGLEARVDLSRLGYGVGPARAKAEARGPARIPSAGRLRPGFVEAVPVRAGDWLLRGARPDLIKLDLNGDERDALKGLRKTLSRARPVLAIDLSYRRSAQARAFMARKGYRLAEFVEWREGASRRAFGVFTPSR